MTGDRPKIGLVLSGGGARGAYEVGARVLMLTVAFVPFFTIWELGRVLGMRRLAAMFFVGPAAGADG